MKRASTKQIIPFGGGGSGRDVLIMGVIVNRLCWNDTTIVLIDDHSVYSEERLSCFTRQKTITISQDYQPEKDISLKPYSLNVFDVEYISNTNHPVWSDFLSQLINTVQEHPQPLLLVIPRVDTLSQQFISWILYLDMSSDVSVVISVHARNDLELFKLATRNDFTLLRTPVAWERHTHGEKWAEAINFLDGANATYGV